MSSNILELLNIPTISPQRHNYRAYLAIIKN